MSQQKRTPPNLNKLCAVSALKCYFALKKTLRCEVRLAVNHEFPHAYCIVAGRHVVDLTFTQFPWIDTPLARKGIIVKRIARLETLLPYAPECRLLFDGPKSFMKYLRRWDIPPHLAVNLK